MCHAITDAILGAAGAGDIGRHFPDTDAAWKDANSIGLLAAAGERHQRGRILDRQHRRHRHRAASEARGARGCHARQRRARAGIAPEQVSVKGKTNEGVDSMGAGDSIAVHAVALLIRS